MSNGDFVERLKGDRAALVAELETMGAEFRGNECKCPFHEDAHPSAGIYQDAARLWRFKCMTASCGASGDIFDMRARRTGRPLADVLKEYRESKIPMSQRPGFRRSPPTGAQGEKKSYPSLEAIISCFKDLTLETTYKYENPETGNIDLAVIRLRDGENKKTFRQAHQKDGVFFHGKRAGLAPIYARKELLKAETVWVVEGEKAAGAIFLAGGTATTAPEGAGKAALADWTPLEGKKKIILWPDSDAPGESHMDNVLDILSRLNDHGEVYRVNPATLGLPEKGDAADLLTSSMALEDKAATLRKIEANATLVLDGDDLKTRLQAIYDGRLRPVPIGEWKMLTHLTNALIPGSVMVLVGAPGSGKSFFVLQTLSEIHRQGHRVALLTLEDSKAFHLQRLLAFLEGDARVMDHIAVERNPEKVDEIRRRHEAFYLPFSQGMTSAPTSQVDYAWVLRWAKSAMEKGAKVLCVDPMTAANAGAKPWEAMDLFMSELKPMLDKYEASAVLITHFKKGGSIGETGAMAGGAGLERFAQTLIQLGSFKDAQCSKAKTPYGSITDVKHNREIFIDKARNGVGSKAKVCFHFDKDSLRFEEMGLRLGKGKTTQGDGIIDMAAM